MPSDPESRKARPADVKVTGEFAEPVDESSTDKAAPFPAVPWRKGAGQCAKQEGTTNLRAPWHVRKDRLAAEQASSGRHQRHED
jgi:hypothetical protein